MKERKGKSDYLLSLIRDGRKLTWGQQLRLTALLSAPAIMAQLSSIAMQYIDASMVGSLGANASASIGLVSTTTWLFSGICSAASTGFSVQVAHRIGAGDFDGARRVLRQALTAVMAFSLVVLWLTGTSINIMSLIGKSCMRDRRDKLLTKLSCLCTRMGLCISTC